MQVQNETQVDFGTECFHHLSHTVDVTTQEKPIDCVAALYKQSDVVETNIYSLIQGRNDHIRMT